MHKATASIICGDSRDMSCIASGEAALVVTSPPYFPQELRSVLAAPRSRQVEVDRVWSRIEAFAEGLRPVFLEMARVVGDRGLCCIETRDPDFGGFRLPLAALHARIAAESGLMTRCDIQFRNACTKPAHFPAFLSEPRVGNFRSLSSSKMLVCSSLAWKPTHGMPLPLSRRECLELMNPMWRVMPARTRRLHEHQTPPSVVRRLIELFTHPGDLVVDPFAGSGQALALARSLGRNAIGYEIDAATHARAEESLIAHCMPRGRTAVRAESGQP